MLTLEQLGSLVDAERAAGHEHIVVPLHRRVSADLLTPVSAFLALRDGADHAFLLESVEGGENLARYSFLGRDPYRVIVGRDNTVEVLETATGVRETRQQTVFQALRQEMKQYREVRLPGLPRLTMGAVGYAAYDTVRLIEHLPDPPPDDLNVPDAIWCFYDTIAAFDHVKHQLVLVSGIFVDPDSDLAEAHAAASERIDRLAELLVRIPRRRGDAVMLAGDMTSNFEREQFEDAVRVAKKHIFEGDIFQVVLSQRFRLPYRGDRFNLYRALRQVNPSPYLFYLDFQDFALIGSSPEVLVRVENGTAEVMPIAGTRPRGETPDADQSFETDLLADPKERAEHLMLVDLGRNDLGRVCEFGSVHVDRYAYIERYSHVMHIVSAVSGALSERKGAVEALEACFPAGTVSGAPKVRAMEIIDDLEPTRRGPYAGAVGHLDFSGNLDTCITIRTMLVRDDAIFVQAGAGIVADSDPASEYEETLNKARALKQAIHMAAGELL
ncbi:MAG: anthranilate synthase component I [Rhodothermales bacterium]|nr:anthranilate synthase component I [Rhodothermales bacterium]MBO6779669.1 anthranilate synthase component I [Rhodothermales bacterium]